MVMIDEAELAAEALAADPDTPVGADAVPLWDVLATGPSEPPLLPEWYMPVAAGGGAALHGWRRIAALAVVGALLLITAMGLCNTYAQMVLD